MNYIEMSKVCETCRLVNDDVSCKECMGMGRCQIEYKHKGDDDDE